MTRNSGAIGGVSDSALARRGLAFGTPLATPAGFTYARSLFPFGFWRDATGVARTNFDRRSWCPTPDVTPWASPASYYADINRADDTGDGLSWANAKKSINAAIAAGNAGPVPYIVHVRAGIYPRGQSPTNNGSVTPNKACALIAVGGRVDTGFFDTLTWTLDQGTTWKATRAGARRAVRLDALDQDGLYPDYAWVADLATCRATPGSWFTDNVTTYVNRADGATVTNANTRVMLVVSNSGPLQMSTGGNMYVSGFDLSGGRPALLQGASAYRFVAEDCTFRYSAGEDGIVTATTANPWNGVSMFDILGAAFIRCDASANQADGFNSHIQSGAQAFVFTMDCTGFNNGRPGATSCNFLTTHDGGRWIDLRGIGARNAGGQVAIVNDNTMMWCIDTLCHASRGDMIFGGSVPPSDFLVDQGTPRLFLENCAGGTSQYSLNARFGTIYARGGKFPMARFTANGGTVGILV